MKKVLFLSGIVTLIMTLLMITGVIDFNSTVDTAIAKGNKHYHAGDYQKAIELYSKAVEANPNQPTIQYNLGLSEYKLGNYEQAAQHYQLSKDTYRVLGNALYRQGSNLEDAKQQMTLYQQGLEQYLKGIKAHPNDLEIKYNYEFLKKLIEDMNDQDQQNQDQQNQDQQNQDQQNQDQQNEDQQNQDQQNEDQQNEDQKNDPTQQQTIDDKIIDQVLKLLEQQEEESLKNNQTVRNQGKEDAYDW